MGKGFADDAKKSQQRECLSAIREASAPRKSMHIPFFSRRMLRGFGAAVGVAAFTSALPGYAAVVGSGTPGSCTEAALDTALSGGGVVTFDCGGGAVTIVLTTQKTLSLPTSIDGGGLVTLDGNGMVPHFWLSNPVNYILTGVNLVNGRSIGDSGGSIIVSGGTLLLNNATLSNNVAVGPNSRGGAIHILGGATVTLSNVRAVGNQADAGGVIHTRDAAGTLLLSEFVAQGNTASNGGGAVLHKGNSLTVQQSLFTGNSVTGYGAVGGAIEVSSGSLAISNSTFQGNTGGAGTAGSAISVADVPSGTVTNSTFADNATAQGAIDLFGSTQLTFRNTIVASTVGQANCRVIGGATIVDGGNNLQFGGTSAQSCGASIPLADPMLAPLADNGGFSQTMALQLGSPAIDAGSACPAADQRGVARPIGPACDIGAYEAALPVVPPAGGAVAVPALAPAGLVSLAALVAGMGAFRRRRGSART